MARRLATLVGCNYPAASRTNYALRGSINNVYAWRDMLLKRFGFKVDDITLLTDSPSALRKPTRANILSELDKMVLGAKAGDVLFFHFSGHAALLKSNPAIVPSDHHLITDVDLQEVVKRVPTGAIFNVLADCSHSGGLICEKKVQIGPISVEQPELDDGILLMSACQADENSSEIDIRGRSYGAFTYAVNNVLQQDPRPLTNRDLVHLARKQLPGLGKEGQHPCLYCSDDNAEAEFLPQP